jgi:7-carboxy-7-deazaguanine synthase
VAYTVMEIFYTIQGEGAQAGRPAVFCRFSGCNLWSGCEADREGADCRFCDTDFVGTNGPLGGVYLDAAALAGTVSSLFPPSDTKPFVVCTGGEPLLQLDPPLIREFHRLGFEVAVETNGTLPAPEGLDWVCVSPKAGAGLSILSGDELKLVFPQEGMDPKQFEGLGFRYFFLQPKDGPERAENTIRALEYCLGHPRWRLSLQIHKIIGIP